MSRTGFKRIRKITPAHQLFNLQRLFRDGKGNVHRNQLEWICTVRPTPIGRDYMVRIRYKPGRQPTVFVVNPCLDELANGRKIPHLYSQKEAKLCLYMPRYKEWRSDMLIAETIVPWTYVWLFYFEEWLFSDEWKGGGEHPPRKD
jgi:hypothetical protein